ncbi:MAG: HDIG domain-containing metalloprotein [Fimbriiglobus sp.]
MCATSRKSPRLAAWDGRRRSSRSDAIDWRGLLTRGVLVRLALVMAAWAGLSAIVIGGGPPFPYRLGQVLPHDIPGVVNRDEPITPAQLAVLEIQHISSVKTMSPAWLRGRAVALAAIIGVLAGTVVVYSTRFQPALAGSTGAVAGVCVLLVGTFALAVWLSRPPWHAAAVPLTLTAMVLTIAYNPPFALFMSVCLGILLALAQGTDLAPLLVQIGGVGTAVLALREVRTRTRPAEVGIAAGVALALMTAATDVLSGQTAGFVLTDAGRNLVWGAAAGFILTGILPLVERAFGVVTDVSLLELSDSSHPLLEELLRRAPGTYTHSMTVATLAEGAAEAIGASPLLARVGCYYHDIGKMLKPHYFIENQSGVNAHDQLEPSLSTLVIVGHVKDGVALAEQYRLPRPIVDFIREHHGTTLVEYFFREALRLHAGANGATPDTLEPTFRYPGPKPQSREACVLMMADAAESAARAHPSPTPANLRKLVRDLATKRLLDGQFDESGLTLCELRAIEDAISKGLVAVYHARVRYSDDEPRSKAA